MIPFAFFVAPSAIAQSWGIPVSVEAMRVPLEISNQGELKDSPCSKTILGNLLHGASKICFLPIQ